MLGALVFRWVNPRICQHTSGTYQNDPQPTVYEEIPSILGFWGCLGYAPGVCWDSLTVNHLVDLNDSGSWEPHKPFSI